METNKHGISYFRNDGGDWVLIHDGYWAVVENLADIGKDSIEDVTSFDFYELDYSE